MSIFEFRTNDKTDGYCFARVEADNKREALAFARKEIFVRELSYRETIEIAQRGLAIVDAKTGKVIGSEGNEEKCESGDPECGPVTHYDSEGVPLCDACYEGLAADSASNVGGNPLGDDAE